jgi:hypothetical protein
MSSAQNDDAGSRRIAEALYAHRRWVLVPNLLPVLVTLGVWAGGLVLGLAHNRSVVWFGTLVAGVLTAALVVDLLVLPALLAAAQWARGREGTESGRLSGGGASRRWGSQSNGPLSLRPWLS